MERSAKHGPRVDDAMSNETESLVRSQHEGRIEEWREMEPAGEDQPVPDALLSGDLRPNEKAMAHETLELRSEIARFVRPSVWPANRTRLLEVATAEEAPARVLDLLRRLPDGREFVNTQDVWRALGGETENARA